MSNPNLPPELLDLIFNLLHDDIVTLKKCCRVSKSWVPGTRRHLFADVKFRSLKQLEAWRNAFPGNPTFPACYTKSLCIGYLGKVATADAQEGGWIPTFSHVRHLELDVDNPEICLTPFHGFSAIKSLHVGFTCSPCSIFNLIYSFPLLEDLSLAFFFSIFNAADFGESPATPQPPSSPAFTGSLSLSVYPQGRIGPIINWLLLLPGGLRFRELKLTLGIREDVLLINALVERCSSTLESLAIDYKVHGMPVSHLLDIDGLLLFTDEPQGPIDLSKATKLRNAAFVCNLDPRLITSTLRTISRKHANFQQLSINSTNTRRCLYFFAPAKVKFLLGQGAYMWWLDLDRFLAQLHELHSIRMKVFSGDTLVVRSSVEYLLPEVTTRGIIELGSYLS